MFKSTASTAAYLGLLAVVLIYSGNLLVGKSVAHLSPAWVSLLRSLIALALVSALFGAATVRHWDRIRPALPGLALVALTGIAGFNIFIYAALREATATQVAVAETTIPAITVLAAALVLRERLRPAQWLGVVVSLAGALWVVSAGDPAVLFGSDASAGLLFMAGAVASWVVYTLAVRRSLGPLPPFAVLPPLLFMAALAQFPIALLWWEGGDLAALRQASVLAALLYLGVFPSIVAFVLYNKAVVAVGPSQAAIFLNLLPICTMIGDRLFYAEPFGAAKVIGTLAVVIGVLLVISRRRR